MKKMILKYCAAMIAGYLSGSILFGYYIPKLVKQTDVYKVSDDGNPGTYNAFVHGGFWCGVMTLLADLLKGFLPVFLSAVLWGTESMLFALIMLAPVAGHAFPWKREGGKAIAVSFGVLLGLLPQVTPLCLLIFFYLLFSLVIKIGEHNKRSMATFFCFAVACPFFDSRTINGCGKRYDCNGCYI